MSHIASYECYEQGFINLAYGLVKLSFIRVFIALLFKRIKFHAPLRHRCIKCTCQKVR